MFVSVPSATIVGARGHEVAVEVHVSGGLPGLTMLGLPDESCRESRDRVRSALHTCGVKWPDKKVIVNLAPPTTRKIGSGLDLAIAVALLVAFEKVEPEAIRGLAFAGELGLDGRVRKVPGIAPMVGVRPDCDWVVPAAGVVEARAVSDRVVRPVESLGQLMSALNGVDVWPDCAPVDSGWVEPELADLADVKGQPHARLALEVAAAGGHHLMFVGPPGSGKTMLARRLVGLLPDLDPDTALEATMIHSAAGVAIPNDGLIRRPPFRAPHHTSTEGSIVGGGSHGLRPGEANLAHGGVLFLDEMGQFAPRALDALREAVEAGHIMVARVDNERIPVPSRFQLVGATNPCPCGGGGPGSCRCDDRSRQRYLGRLSGPFLDRFDLRIGVQRPNIAELLDGAPAESSASVTQRVQRVRDIAEQRTGVPNAQLNDAVLDEFARPDADGMALLRTEMESGALSARGFYRLRRVARTLSDLAGETEPTIAADFVAGAMSMRSTITADCGEVAA